MSDLSINWQFLEGLGFDISYVERTLPEKYRRGLTPKEQEIARGEAEVTMKMAKDSKVSPKELYKDWESDKRYRSRNKEMPKSKATLAYENKFSESDPLRGKSKKSGISYGILKEVYNRGMAAWRSGHRPGVAPQQWALGRVNSFITGVGKARKADADLWQKHTKRTKK